MGAQACIVLGAQESGAASLAYYTPEILTRVRIDSQRILSKKKKKNNHKFRSRVARIG